MPINQLKTSFIISTQTLFSCNQIQSILEILLLEAILMRKDINSHQNHQYHDPIPKPFSLSVYPGLPSKLWLQWIGSHDAKVSFGACTRMLKLVLDTLCLAASFLHDIHLAYVVIGIIYIYFRMFIIVLTYR